MTIGGASVPASRFTILPIGRASISASRTHMNLSEIKRTLDEHGIRLSRSLGQNFLHDKNQLSRIVTAAELSRSDKVLEIGPGLGPLTALLARDAGEILAIEKDARLLG